MGETTRTTDRVAWVIRGDENYGVRALVLNLAEGVSALGVEPRFVSLTDGPFASELKAMGRDVRTIASGAPSVLRGNLLKKARIAASNARRASTRAAEVAAALESCPPLALHVVWPTMVSIAGAAAMRLDIPCFWEMPNIISDTYPFAINRRVYQWTCRTYAVTVLADSHYTASTYSTGPDKPQVFYHAVNSPRFNPDVVHHRSRASLGIPTEATVFAIAARLDPQKGHVLFFRALMNADPHAQPAHLLVLGGPTDGPVANELREIARKHGATDRLHLIGSVPDPQTYYHAADIAVNSRIDPEPFGISVIEALLMQKPVLAHALGGPSESVLDTITGWHVHAPTHAAWVSAINRAVADRSRWKDMGRHARNDALERFSMEARARDYLDIVLRAAGRSKSNTETTRLLQDIGQPAGSLRYKPESATTVTPPASSSPRP